jgi:hypothetical protein
MRPLFLLLLLSPAVCFADELPLFASNEALDITLEFPLSTIIRQAAKQPVVSGTAYYTDTDGQEVSVPIKISTRGKSRLAMCRFPPLSLIVSKKHGKDTIFEGQKQLKITTHCRANSSFRSYILQEYSIYRAFNVLTDISFRARYLNITYQDSEKPSKVIQESGFILESVNGMVDRTGLQRQKLPRINPSQLDADYSALAALFQFLIGNTDWSISQGHEGANCCHNGKVLSPPDSDHGWRVVPYDFDQSGIINTSYAMPSETLRIRSVRQRLFRGRCRHLEGMDGAIALFNQRRQELEAALLPEAIKKRKSAVKYVDEFYEIINDPKERQISIDGRCRGK